MLPKTLHNEQLKSNIQGSAATLNRSIAMLHMWTLVNITTLGTNFAYIIRTLARLLGTEFETFKVTNSYKLGI